MLCAWGLDGNLIGMKQVIKYKAVKTKSSRCRYLDSFFALVFFQIILLTFVSSPVYAALNGDFDNDSDVDLVDMWHLTSRWLNTCTEPNFCDDADLDYSLQVDFNDFAILASNWGPTIAPPPPSPDNFTVFNENLYPTRLAMGPNDDIYVTDAKSGSMFVYDPNLTLTGELRRLGKPLGLAVDAAGNIYVGSSDRKAVEIYNSKGVKTNTIGLGLIEMPSDLAFDNNGKLYVVDSKKNTVWVFNPNGAVIRSIGGPGTGDGKFDFPIALEIAYRTDSNGLPITELFVADRGNYLIQVFDLDGNFKRSFGEPVNQSMMGGWRWQGKFVKLQSLAMDSDDDLHVLDCYMNKVQMLDPNTGAYRDSYGDLGAEEDKLSLPFDVLIDVNEIPDGNDISIITDTGKERIEAYTIEP